MTGGLAAPPPHIQRVAFLGTPDASVDALRALVVAGFDVPVVISRPDRRRGRGSKLIPSPVKQAALDLGLEVSDTMADLADRSEELALDLAVVVAYGRIIPVSLLERIPMVNLHFSLLPRWRGAAPVERAILAGDTETGVCLMEVAEGLDEGGIYATVTTDIDQNETAAELRARLAVLGADLLVESLRTGLGPAVAQDGEVTYAAKIEREESRLDFTRSAVELHRRVMVGRAWCTFRDARLGIEETRVVDGTAAPGQLAPGDKTDSAITAGTGRGLIELRMVKPEGKRAMPAADWMNGAKPQPGEQLG